MNKSQAAWVLTIQCCCSLALAQDRVTFQSDAYSRPVVLVGDILDYNGKFLTIHPREGVAHAIDADDVLAVETYYPPDHQAALQALKENQQEQALELLEKALAKEPREWVKREIKGAKVRCCLRQQDLITAAQVFQEITVSDPETRHWGIAPLIWAPAKLGAAALQYARIWSSRDDEALKLVGASWLLLDPTYGEGAERELKRLGKSKQHRISTLARMQLWRLDLAAAQISEEKLSSWYNDLQRLPESLRGGPQYLRARGFESLGRTRQAAAEYLWLPMVYSHLEPLSARSLLEAAEALHSSGLEQEARTLYFELQTRYPWAPEVSAGRKRFEG